MRHIHKTRYNEQVLSIASHKLGELKIIEFAREIERIYIYIYPVSGKLLYLVTRPTTKSIDSSCRGET